MMRFLHVDVFSAKVLSGNGLTVVFLEEALSNELLLRIAQEFKQFETIFVYPKHVDGTYKVRIFTVDEELPFAGHPVIGVGAVIHKLFYFDQKEQSITLTLGNREVKVISHQTEKGYQVTMNQGIAEFIGEVSKSDYQAIAHSLNLAEQDIDTAYPIEVVSTGLPYLLVPLKTGIDKCQIMYDDFEAFLNKFGAKFVYAFDSTTLTCRTWDNIAKTEDVATGSAAGPLCAYLVKEKIKSYNETIALSQGEFVGRPSMIEGFVNKENQEIFITGDVAFLAQGEIDSQAIKAHSL